MSESTNQDNVLLEYNNATFGEMLGNAQKAYYAGDFRIAIDHFSRAASLGSLTACQKLGQMYMQGEGCETDRALALEFLRRGIKLGNESCYADLFELYADSGFCEDDDFATAIKCMDRYFASGHYIEEIETEWGGFDTALSGYCQILLSDVTTRLGRSIPQAHLRELSKNKQRLIASMHDMAEALGPDLGDMWLEKAEILEHAIP